MDQLGIEIKKEASTSSPLRQAFSFAGAAADIPVLHIVGAYPSR